MTQFNQDHLFVKPMATKAKVPDLAKGQEETDGPAPPVSPLGTEPPETVVYYRETGWPLDAR